MRSGHRPPKISPALVYKKMPPPRSKDAIVADVIQMFDDGTTLGDILRDWVSGRVEKKRSAEKERKRRAKKKAAAQPPAEVAEEATAESPDAPTGV